MKDIVNLALIAHDKKKDSMVKFCIAYESVLSKYTLYATGTTGQRIVDETKLNINRLSSGPLGGDAEISSKIVNKEIDLVIFLRDPLTAQPHEPDIQALIRLCDVYEVPIATNLASAEFYMSVLSTGGINRKFNSQLLF